TLRNCRTNLAQFLCATPPDPNSKGQNTQMMQEAVIVSTARTGIGKAYRGAFNDTSAPRLGAHVVRAAIDKAGVHADEVEDVLIGTAAQQGTQGYNLGRLTALAAGLPDSVAGATLDRMCASGLMTIAWAAKS